MATLFFDGFEQFDQSRDYNAQMRKADYVVAGQVYSGAGRRNGKCLTTFRSSISRTVNWVDNILSFGFAMKHTARGGICSLGSINFVLDADDGAPRFLTAKGITLPILSKWYYFEVEANKATRTISFYINGKLDGQATLPDNLIDEDHPIITLNAYNARPSLIDDKLVDNATRMYDDFYIYNGSRLSPVQITTRLPTSDIQKQWMVLPDGIQHWQAVGQLPTDELNRYIITHVNNAVDEFGSTQKLPDANPVIAVGALGLLRSATADMCSVDFKVGQRIQNVGNLTPTWHYRYVNWMTDPAVDTPASVEAATLSLIAGIGR